MLEIATWLVLQRGFSVIPVARASKTPLIKWAKYQSQLPTLAELRTWFPDDSVNVGIVTGLFSRIVVHDADTLAAERLALRHFPPTPMRTRTGGGGLHLFYQHPGRALRNKVRLKVGGQKVALDLRADGGYVVAPGSLHESGNRYRREGTWPTVDQLPIFDVAWVGADALELDQPLPTPRVGAPVVREPDALRRARAYVRQVPPAIEGAGGDTKTFSLACTLVRGFGLSDAEALDLLREWNHGCVPPWTSSDLVGKVRGAHQYGEEPVGGRLQECRA